MIFFVRTIDAQRNSIGLLTGESEVTDEFGKVMLVDYRLRFPLTRKIFDDYVGAFHWTHAENSPEEGLQGGLEINEGVLLFSLQFRLIIGLYHSVIILVEMAQSLEERSVKSIGWQEKKILNHAKRFLEFCRFVEYISINSLILKS